MTTDSIPEPYLQQILEKITKKEGYKKPRYEVCIGTKAGDNYVGLVYRVVVREEDGGKNGESQSFIFKAMPKSAKRREAVNMNLLFKTEADMYTVVLPAYASLMKEKGIPVKDGIYPGTAKCFAAHLGEGEEGEGVLVLDDMRPKGFTMHDRKVALDVHHCRLVLGALARLHASSFAYELHRPEEFKRFKQLVKERLFHCGNPVAKQLTTMVARTYDNIKECFPEGRKEYEKLKPFLDNYMDNMCDLVQADPEGGNVICHGDCWINNLLFKYSEAGRPTDVILLDWQVSRYAPPTIDLTYFLYMGTATSTRDEHLQSLLRFYYEELSTNLEILGLDVSKVYSWDLFQKQFRRCGMFGVCMGFVGIPIILNEDANDQDDAFENGAGVEDMFLIKFSPEVNDRIFGCVKDATTLGFV